jgi:hypothetical protein
MNNSDYKGCKSSIFAQRLLAVTSDGEKRANCYRNDSTHYVQHCYTEIGPATGRTVGSTSSGASVARVTMGVSTASRQKTKETIILFKLPL